MSKQVKRGSKRNLLLFVLGLITGVCGGYYSLKDSPPATKTLSQPNIKTGSKELGQNKEGEDLYDTFTIDPIVRGHN